MSEAAPQPAAAPVPASLIGLYEDIEIINYNPEKDIIHFIKTLSNNFQYVKYDNKKIINLDQTIDLIKKTLQKKPTIDIFLIKK